MVKTICNAHTHLELSDLGRVCPKTPISFGKWMGHLILRLWRRSPARYQEAVTKGIRMLQDSGTTHVHDVTNTWLGVEVLLTSGLQGCVYLEVLGQQRDRALSRLKKAIQRIGELKAKHADSPMKIGLSMHSTWSCHPDSLRAAGTWCRENNTPLCIHTAESPTETELLLTGRVRELGWLRSRIGRWLNLLPPNAPGLRPVRYLESLGILTARPLLIHAVQVLDEDIATIARYRCPVVHCPRSNVLLSCGVMPLRAFLEAGVQVFLGTDSLASSPNLDVRDEAACAKTLHAGQVSTTTIDALLHPPG